MGPLGLRYAEEDGFWELTVYPTPVELVGGARDGAVVAPWFSLDLEQLRAAFAPVTALSWNAWVSTSPKGRTSTSRVRSMAHVVLRRYDAATGAGARIRE
jgi:hypothetical protein